MAEWCPRCGGPIADEVCENCISAAERGQHEKQQLSLQRAKVWRWVERFTVVPPQQDPMSALLLALLVEATELHALFGPENHIHVLKGDRVERVVAVPAYVARNLALFLQHASTQKPVRNQAERSGVIEVFLAKGEHGHGVRLQTEHFVVASIAGGYSVRLR